MIKTPSGFSNRVHKCSTLDPASTLLFPEIWGDIKKHILGQAMARILLNRLMTIKYFERHDITYYGGVLMVGLGSINQKIPRSQEKINGNSVLRCPLGVQFWLDVRFFLPKSLRSKQQYGYYTPFGCHGNTHPLDLTQSQPYNYGFDNCLPHTYLPSHSHKKAKTEDFFVLKHTSG